MGKKRASPGADTEKSPFGDTELNDVQSAELEKISKESDRVDIALEFLTQENYAPFLEKRREVLKGIPAFWPVALLNHPSVSIHAVHQQDQVALSYLEDVWLTRDPVEKRCFTLEFYFKENPFFSNSVLKKEYRYSPSTNADNVKKDEHGITDAQATFSWDADVEAQAMKIDWKDDGHNLTKAYPQILDEGELSETGSFFNLFESSKDHTELGVAIANEIFPEAIDYFKGIATQTLSDEDEDEEDEEDDDDVDEIDLEKPRPKKQRT